MPDFSEVDIPHYQLKPHLPPMAGTDNQGWPVYPVPPPPKVSLCDFCGGPAPYPPHPLGQVPVGRQTWKICGPCEVEWTALTHRLGQGKRRLNGLPPKEGTLSSVVLPR